MKKIFTLLICLICLPTFASEFKSFPYKNIKNGNKITITNSNEWTAKVKRKNNFYTLNGSLLFSSEESKTFDTDCDYIFLSDGRLIGYSSPDLKFYEFIYSEDGVSKEMMCIPDLISLFKDFRIILISEFTDTTNVYQFKKTKNSEKIMIINDTDSIFENYGFTTNNAQFEKYEINNAIEITKKGLIQFSSLDDNTKLAPWFIVLVR